MALLQTSGHGADGDAPAFALSATRSFISFNPPAPTPNPYHDIPDYLFALGSPRKIALGDFNCDGTYRAWPTSTATGCST
jgi:hypothetical protein